MRATTAPHPMAADSSNPQQPILFSASRTTASGHAVYCRTHDHRSMAVASEREVSAFFDIPSTIETDPSKLEVVTNGIPSRPESVEVY